MKSFDDVRKAAEKAGMGRTFRDLSSMRTHGTYSPTNIFILDLLLWGGIHLGQMTEFIGRFSSGKTTMALKAVAAFQFAFPTKRVVYIDKEGTLDFGLAELLGVDLSPEAFTYLTPASGEDTADFVDEFVEVGEVGFIVVDSIPAMMAQKEIDKAADEAVMALHARLVGRMTAKVTTRMATNKMEDTPHEPIVLFVNQWRSGVGGPHAFKSRPGGNAYPYFLHESVEFANKEALGHVGDIKAQVVTANDYSFEMLKNKGGNSMKVGAFTINRDPTHPRGIGWVDQSATILAFAKTYGLLVPAGSNGATLLPWGVTRKMEKTPSLTEWLDERPGCSEWLQREIVSRHRAAFKKPRDGWFTGRTLDLEEPLAKDWS